MTQDSTERAQTLAFPAIREGAIDLLRAAARKHMIHALFEVDVTVPRRFLRERKAQTGEALSFTAFIVKCLAQAVDENRQLNSYRKGARRLIVFDDVDVNTMVEREVGGRRMGTPNIIRAANHKTLRQIHAEIRSAQASQAEAAQGMGFFRWAVALAYVPIPLRSLLWRSLSANPQAMKHFAGTVGVTAVGMFGMKGGWGITIPFLTTNVVVGGIAEKPGVVQGRIEPREYLCLTLSVDHDIVDGAPAARFSARFRELIEGGFGLQEEGTA
jgi:pyruvate/2-oxoglutarate dehydrogenase complex dihydrolipoamide acyltransferase (E2) component